MSRTTILAIYPGEKYERIRELDNAWGSAPVIWDVISQRYLGTPAYEYLFQIEKLWPLWQDLKIPKAFRAVLMMTYDRMYVVKEDYARAAKDITTFWAEFKIGSMAANHWPEIALFFESNPEYPALGFWCTSVSENPFLGTWNEEKEEHNPLDWNAAYDLYAELDGLEDSSCG